MTAPRELKSLPEGVAAFDPIYLTECKAEGGRFKIAGYGSIFGVADRGGDIVEAGAFAESLAARKAAGEGIAMLWQHNPEAPIGIWTEVSEDARGLKVSGELLADVPKGAEAIALVKAGALSGLSIGYRTRDSVTDETTGLRRLKSLELWEVSLVTFPMNAGAQLAGVKDLAAFELAQIKRNVESSLGAMPGVTRKEARAGAAAACDRILAGRDAGAALDLTPLRDSLAAWRG